MRGKFWRVVAPVVFLIAGMWPVTAQAHRDGCHRWHSCPSDSGSYVCGDMGYDSECPGGGAPEPEPEPYQPPDSDPPAQPTIVEAEAVGSRVRMVVNAESGSRLIVHSGAAVLHRAAATGQDQALEFSAPDGRVNLRVTATDRAGNVSPEAARTLTVDGTAPAVPALELTPAAPGSPDTALQVTGEPGATVELQVAAPDGSPLGAVVTAKVPASGQTRVARRLPNGSYLLRVTLIDVAGNRSGVVQLPHDVAVAPPAKPVLRLAGERGADPVLVSVRGEPFTTARVSAEAGGKASSETVALGPDGRGQAELRLPDGEHTVRAVLEDFQGQASPEAVLDDVLVKSTPPVLKVLPLEGLRGGGVLVLALLAEKGADVRITSGEFEEQVTATGELQEVILTLGDGAHQVTLLAEDRYGNTSTFEHSVELRDSAGAGTLFGGLALLGAGALGGRRLWRRAKRRASPSQAMG